MKLRFFWNPLRIGAVLSAALMASTGARPQSAERAISLDPSTLMQSASLNPVKGEASFANAPANFYAFHSARVGEPANLDEIRLRFATATTLKSITSTKDFPIEDGGSCVAGRSYAKGDTCILLVRFTPQGAGARRGKLTVTRSGSIEPDAFGLGGYGYSPIISFTPAVISTVPGTYPSKAGLLTGAQNLTVDGSDTVFIADTGNGIIRQIDSSGSIVNLTTGYTGALGIAVDNFGEVYFDTPSANKINEIYDYGPVVQITGTTTGSCPASTPCELAAHAISAPGEMSIDPYNHLFWADADAGAAFSTVQPLPASLIYLYDPFPYQTNPSSAMAVDAGDNLYSMWSNGGECEMVQSSLYNAENSLVTFNKIAGGHTCGFSGDGGQAGNAEMGAKVGQIAFDVFGDLYFTDTANQRVRRIDYNTGNISTIAGNGTAGYTGDGNQATTAELSAPTGVAVDSQGQVYIISGAAASGTAQVVRKLGPKGFLAFSTEAVGTTSAVRIVTVTNTGNSGMTLTRETLTGNNAADFAINNNATSCNLTAGATLAAGQHCQIGVVFKPTATGARTATLTLVDNTVNNSNEVQLSGVGTSSAAKINPGSLTFPSTTQNQSATVPVTVTNDGNASLTISGITIGGTNPKMFTYTNSCGTGPIAPKATCKLQVTFKPTSAGSYSALVKVADNAPDSPQSVAVSGTGVPAASITTGLLPQ